MKEDQRGCAVSGANGRALEHYERAVAMLACHRGEPLAEARAACREAPGFVAARQLEAWLLLSGRDPRSAAEASGTRALLAKLPMNERERRHCAALDAALAHDPLRTIRLLDGITEAHPHNLVALIVANGFDYLLGDTASQARRANRAIAAWVPGMPGYHAALAMQAFALEESGEYGRAEEAARGALEREPLDLRALHAVAHVHEMRGDPEAGIRWMGERAQYWSAAGPAATHHWWHLALFHLERGDRAHALRIYDRRIGFSPVHLSELIDGSALLWRLELAAAVPGARWQALAERWAPHAEDGYCPFTDIHAMMAFVGARRGDLAQKLLATVTSTAGKPGVAGAMARLVGVPACRALHAFGNGDHVAAERLLRSLPPVSHKIGGSHAQREVLELTRFAARRQRAAA